MTSPDAKAPSAEQPSAGRLETRAGAVLVVVIASASFAASTPLGRYARPADPLVIAFGRLALAALVLLFLDARTLATSVRALTTKQRLLVLTGGALLGLHFAAFQWGLDHTSLPAAASLVSLEPISVVVVAWLVFGTRPRRVDQIALFIATIGAAVVGSASGRGDHRIQGDLVVVFGIVLYGFYLAVARGLSGAIPTRSYVAIVYAAAAVTVALLLPWSESTRPPASFEMPLHSALSIVFLAVVPTIVGHTAVQMAARTLSPSIVALVSPGETLGALVIGAVMLGAIPTSREVVGAALILAGTTLALVSTNR